MSVGSVRSTWPALVPCLCLMAAGLAGPPLCSEEAGERDRASTLDEAYERAMRNAIDDAIAEVNSDSVRILSEILKEANPRVRVAALSGLRELGPDALPAVPIVRGLLRDSDVDARIAALLTFGAIGPAAGPMISIADVRHCLNDSESGVQHYMPSTRFQNWE